jgi:hypothetical protein
LLGRPVRTSELPVSYLAVEHVQDSIVGLLCLEWAEDLADECQLLLIADGALQQFGIGLVQKDRPSSEEGLLVRFLFQWLLLEET